MQKTGDVNEKYELVVAERIFYEHNKPLINDMIFILLNVGENKELPRNIFRLLPIQSRFSGKREKELSDLRKNLL